MSGAQPAAKLRQMASYMLAALVQIKKISISEGIMACPACGGILRWRKVGPKQHVRAACETTPNCLSFLE